MLILRTDYEIDGEPLTRFTALTTDGSAVIGFVELKHANMKSAKFIGLFIVKEFRRRGIAKEMLGMCERLARGSGCQTIACIVTLRNEIAQALYAKLGYRFAWEFTDDHDRIMFKQL